MDYTCFYNLADADSELSDEVLKGRIIGWRNFELQMSDWTQLPDVSISSKTQWAKYRQDLRDLPQQGPDPKVWVFPERP